MKERTRVEAAGGVVLRGGKRGAAEVLVVYRPRRKDWSLPKGKLDRGESPRAAAIREVREETGVRARPDSKLGAHVYTVPSGRKRVRWYLMTPIKGDPTKRKPDREIQEAAWWPLEEAFDRLTYDRDRALLREAAERWER